MQFQTGGVQSAGVSNVVGLILGLCLGGILLIVVGFVIGWFGRGKRFDHLDSFAAGVFRKLYNFCFVLCSASLW
jgi:hypothetical protein